MCYASQTQYSNCSKAWSVLCLWYYMHYDEPLKSFDKSRVSPSFLLSRYCHDCAESDVKQYLLTHSPPPPPRLRSICNFLQAIYQFDCKMIVKIYYTKLLLFFSNAGRTILGLYLSNNIKITMVLGIDTITPRSFPISVQICTIR